MNCEKGDLAVVTSGHLSGRIVTCVEMYYSRHKQTPCWKVTPKQKMYAGFADRVLKPLRNKPGEDETLQWAPVPSIGEPA